ncbi:MAG: tetratricopeptide repeat protein [Chloroflexi bacterium]|nr:tetratricopeptide repeat protein [Chloroflexota bacterium]
MPGTQLTITEPSFADLGLPVMSLDDYTTTVISTNRGSLKDFTIVTQTYVDLTGGAKAKLTLFSVDDNGLRMFYRLIYVQDNLILNFTYTYRPALDNIASLIKYSFGTLRLDYPPSVGSIHGSALTTVSEYLKRGTGLLDKGDFANAISDFTKAIELDPRSAEAYFHRGNAYSDSGDDEQAIADYTKSIDLNPKEGNPYYNRANVYYRRLEIDKAIADYTKAIELDAPYSPESYFNRAKSYAFKRQFDKAIADLTDAIKLRPDYLKAYDERAIVYAAGLREFDKAIQDHSKAIDLDPKRAQGYFNRGITHMMMAQPSLASADFNKVIEISTDPLEIANAKDMLSRLPK